MALLDVLLFLIPIYIANSSPVVLGGGIPLDFGRRLNDGERILGEGKTIRGFIGGILAGTVAGGIVTLYYPLPFFVNSQTQFFAGFVLAFGTLCGDALGSFIKRRVKIQSGKPFLLDMIMFLILALFFVMPFAKGEFFTYVNLVFIFVLTLIIHPSMNILANKIGLKKVPW
ncbi:MAG: CDP-2,3-bis-(O-geranylgeranyl)-sn-glycerol synthase [Candidatus Micrarchaeota archaeon]